ncbi:MAG TPA: protein-glutamate O-methyltransferase CheR [Candidatus Angelobacter sp.]
MTEAAIHKQAGAGFRLSRSVFLLFQELVHSESGIWLGEHKKMLLCGRLAKRLRQLDLSSFESYYSTVKHDPKERWAMLDLLTTNETHFFRDPQQFRHLEEEVIPEWKREADAGKRPRMLKIWSAGCSTGEEPYSILMVLLDHFSSDSRWSIRVLGTDISARVLNKAEQGQWPVEQAQEIPPPRLKRYMLKGLGHNDMWMQAKPELRDRLTFASLNLNSAEYNLKNKFDAVFCRNVLIYFSAASKAEVVRKLFCHLAPGGRLFLSPVESSASKLLAKAVFPGVFGARE